MTVMGAILVVLLRGGLDDESVRSLLDAAGDAFSAESVSTVVDTLSAVLSTFVFFALGILFAAIGAGYWSALLMLGPMVGMLAVSIYCKRAGIDFAQSVARIRPIRLTVSYIVSICLALAWLLTMTYHRVNGHPLFSVGLGSTMGDSNPSGSPIFGGIMGMAAVIVLITISRYRKRAQAREEAARVHDIDDED